jgi:hypothetical protein
LKGASGRASIALSVALDRRNGMQLVEQRVENEQATYR